MDNITSETKPNPRVFSASALRRALGSIFREVERNGKAYIDHANYPDYTFVVTKQQKGERWNEQKKL